MRTQKCMVSHFILFLVVFSQNFLRFLRVQRSKVTGTLDFQRRAEIRADLKDKALDAEQFVKQNKIRVEKETAEREGQWSARAKETLELIKIFARSAQVQRDLQDLQTDMALQYKQGRWTKYLVRDILMAHLMISGGLHAIHVVRGVTLGEWQHVQTVQNSYGSFAKVVRVLAGRTDENYLIVKYPEVFLAIQAYVDTVRPDFMASSSGLLDYPSNPSLALFPGKHGNKLPNSNGGPLNYIKTMLRSEGIPEESLKGFGSKDLHSAAIYFGLSCDDPSIRESVAELLCNTTQGVQNTRLLRKISLRAASVAPCSSEDLGAARRNVPPLEASVPADGAIKVIPTAALANENKTPARSPTPWPESQSVPHQKTGGPGDQLTIDQAPTDSHLGQVFFPQGHGAADQPTLCNLTPPVGRMF